MRPKHLFGLLVAAVSAASIGASGAGNAPVTTCTSAPTVVECSDPTFQATPRGKNCAAICNDLVTRAGADAAKKSTSTVDGIQPPGMPHAGQLRPMRALPTTSNKVALDRDLSLSYFGGRWSSATARLLLTTADKTSKHPEWENDLNDVGECAEYVWKKYYDYSRFEDAAETCGENDWCIYDLAMDTNTPGLNKPGGLLDKYGDPLPVQLPHPPHAKSLLVAPSHSRISHFFGGGGGADKRLFQKKNAFFQIDHSIILKGSLKYGSDPEFTKKANEMIAATRGVAPYDVTDRWAWHVKMHDAQTKEPIADVEREDIEVRTQSYLDLVSHYRALKGEESVSSRQIALAPPHWKAGSAVTSMALTGIGKKSLVGPYSKVLTVGKALTPSRDTYLKHGSSYIKTSPALALQTLKNAMADQLLEEWDHKSVIDGKTVDHGCVSPASNRCDWTPRMFTDEYTGLWQQRREADFLRCVDATGDEFDGLPESATNDPESLERYFVERFAELDAEAAKLPWKDESRKTIRVQGPGDDRTYGWKDVLSAGYRYDAWFEIAGDKRDGRLCRLDSEIYGSAYASVDVLGKTAYTLVDALLDASIGRKGVGAQLDSKLTLFNNEVLPFKSYVFPKDGARYPGPAFERTPKLFSFQQVFFIGPIPAHVKFSLQANLGFTSEFGIVPPKSDCDPENLAYALEGVFTPHAQLDAKAQLGVGIPGCSAGVRGELQVITVNLPVNATLSLTNPKGAEVALKFKSDAAFDANLLAGRFEVYAEFLFWETSAEIFKWKGIPVRGSLWNNSYEWSPQFMQRAFQ